MAFQIDADSRSAGEFMRDSELIESTTELRPSANLSGSSIFMTHLTPLDLRTEFAEPYGHAKPKDNFAEAIKFLNI